MKTKQFVNKFEKFNRKKYTILHKNFCSTIDPLNYLYDLSEDRTLLRIKGEDTAKFLQSIYSQDLRILFKEELEKEKDSVKSLHLRDFEGENKNAIYGCFLNAKSRILFEAFLIKEENESTKSVKMEIDKTLLPTILKYLSFQKLRLKVEIETLQKQKSIQSNDQQNQSDQKNLPKKEELIEEQQQTSDSPNKRKKRKNKKRKDVFH
jgi:folate-binding Fe-S cluster repair protein YgfZ